MVYTSEPNVIATIQCEVCDRDIAVGDMVFTIDEPNGTHSNKNQIPYGRTFDAIPGHLERFSKFLGIALASGKPGTCIALQVYGIARVRLNDEIAGGNHGELLRVGSRNHTPIQQGILKCINTGSNNTPGHIYVHLLG